MSDLDPTDRLAQSFAAHLEAVEQMRDTQSEFLAELAIRCEAVLRNGGKLCLFGNGGSAADAQHIATEFVVRFTRQRKALAAIAFTTDTSALTAGANDFGFKSVFARQVEALCGPEDAVIGISTSGTSANVIRGLEAAKEVGAFSVAFTGSEPSPCEAVAEITYRAPSKVTARVQECHLLAGHLICDLVEAAFCG